MAPDGMRGAARLFLPAVFLALTLALGACASAGSCIESIPDELRPDVVRYVVVTNMVREVNVPRRDLDLSRERGVDPKELSEERTMEVKRYASTYALCVNRLQRDR